MKFNDYVYTRPQYDDYKVALEGLISELELAKNAQAQLDTIKKINLLRADIDTMGALASIRYSIDTQDDFYTKEDDYWNEYQPLYTELDSKFYKVITESHYKIDLENKLGKQFMNLVECHLKAFSSQIIAELQEENRLITEYNKLIAAAKISFDGKELNLSGLRPYMVSTDRKVREAAHKAYFSFFAEYEENFDTIYDKLVKVRHRMAQKLGYNNYVELGYIRMNRTDYNPEMVAKFRAQVLEHIVPQASKLYERQAERLGLKHLSYFDQEFEFQTGNATPKGDPEFILNCGKQMYSELSPETKEFFEFMTTNELMDLVNKEGKQAGGYCTYIPNHKAPFIFSNFNSTSDDIDVLTHEAGHAFQVYRSRWIEQPETIWPTYESCEIHSMSMEFITWPWMTLFLTEDTDKYKFVHLGSAIKFIPYGITVDAFQHFIYEHPEATPSERKTAWRDLEKLYLPDKDYEGCDLLERGGWWFKQGHIFSTPFYYIDYTLAQICALQFWKKFKDNRKEAWQDYLGLCDVGGTKSFLGLVEHAHLISPFEEGCVASIIGDIDEWLEQVEDKKL